MANHPSKAELSGFLLGKLPQDACEAVAEHVEQCPPCQQTIQSLESHEDTLAELLGQPSPVQEDERSQVVVDKIAAIVQATSDGLSNTQYDGSQPEEKTLTTYTQAKLNIPAREAFERALKASGAIDDEEWQRLQKDLPALAQAQDAAELAKLLVQHGALTKFQATLLYQGKSGLRMGEYIVLDQIGAGGMGQVFKARHRRMDRVVALKVLAKSAMDSPEAVKRFQREVKAAAKLSHPHIVTAYDAGEQDGVHFLVMEYVAGHDLSSLIKQQGPVPPDQVVAYIAQAARGLAFAHSKGVVHRDIKPANLLLDADGTVKILDMGLARLDGDNANLAAFDGLTQSGQVMGTVDYMAPEQAFDTRTADAKADVYSLGCTIYRLVTGRNAYDGETLVQKILAHREQPIPALQSPHGSVPPALEALYRRMMAKQPTDRPTMTEVATELESIHKAATVGRAAAESAPHIVVAPHKAATVGRGVRGSGRGRRPTLKYLAAAAGAAALLFFGVWLIVRDKDGKTVAEIDAALGTKVHVPAGGSVEVATQPATPKPSTPSTVPADQAKNVIPTTSTPPQASATTPVQTGIASPAPPPGDYALRFDGNSIVDLKNLTTTNYPSEKDDITLEAYVTPEGLKVWSRIVGSERRAELSIERRVPDATWKFSHSSQGKVPRSPVTPNRRVHVAGVRRNNENFLFVDGKLVAHLPDAPLTDKINQRWSIGAQLVGIIDEVRISNTARYSQDFIPAARFETDDKTTALYHFDEGTGDVLRDASGNGADGKITGATWVRADGSAITPTVDWHSLFDGKSLAGWQGIDKPELPAGWRVEGDAIVAPGSKTSIATVAEYGDFELELDWKVQPGGNGGVFYGWHGVHFPSATDGLLLSAPEYQVVDNIGHPNGKQAENSAGSVFDVYAPSKDCAKPAGQWNTTRIVVRGPDVEHYLNGDQIVAYTLGSDDWKQRIAKHPRFSKEPEYGRIGPGRIALQSNTGLVYYRNIRLRPFDGKSNRTPPPLAIAPFDAAQAKAHQAAWAKHLGTTVETTNSVGAKMILIPPGEFLMGSTDDQVAAALKIADEVGAEQLFKDRFQQNERPQHKVVITKPLLMSMTEVTVGQFKKFAAATGFQTEAEKAAKDTKTGTYLAAASDDFPAALITWNDAVAYCKWLSEQEKTTYRLPTEAEWEYACRAGTTTQYSFGDDYNELPKYGWHLKNARDRSHPVGMLLPNPFGLFDMHGNLYEWCGDYHNEKWYSESTLNDPNGPFAGTLRVLRGGQKGGVAVHGRSATRYGNPPSNVLSGYGFRIVRVLGVSASHPTLADPAFQKWMTDVQAMPAEKQIEAVSKKMMELNPGFDGKLTGCATTLTTAGPKITDGVVTELRFVTDQVGDLSPVRALGGLKKLNCSGSNPGKGRLADLSPLAGLKLAHVTCSNTRVADLSPLSGMPLTHLACNGTQITDLAPLAGMSLVDLRVHYTGVSDLSPLKGMKIGTLYFYHTPVSDLASLAGMPLTSLDCSETQVSDLSPLKGMQLTYLWFHDMPVSDVTLLAGMPLKSLRFTPTNITRGIEVLRAMTTLSNMGLKHEATGVDVYKPDEFWKKYDAGEFGKPAAPKKLAYLDPAFQQWVAETQQLPAEQQLVEVSKKLMELNPGFDGKLTDSTGGKSPTIESLQVSSVGIKSDHVTDLSPLRAFSKLRYLNCLGVKFGQGRLADLSPLARLDLVHFATVTTAVADLEPLGKCPALVKVTILDTHVTAEQVAKLQAALPKCQITWDGRTDNAGENRRAAEWFLNQGVGLQILIQLRPVEVLKLEQLPAEPFWINSLSVKQATDEHAARISKCYGVTYLNLQLSTVSDAGLVHLQELSKLETLYLSNSRVTDAGLAHLVGLAKLKTLTLDGTKVTAAGVATLQKALPNCKIEWDEPAKTPAPPK